MTAALRPRTIALAVAATLVAGLVVAVPRAAAEQQIHRVPSDATPTIQSAVDAAAPGDLILVSPGVYDGGVEVPPEKPNLTIRGLDRNEVVLDGDHTRNIGIRTYADGTVIENLTARNFTQHGLYWRGVDGYAGRYLTAYNNRLYGIYAFDSVNGIFEQSYASGSADASFYIGQCNPCDSVITDVVAEYSALGYSGTNAGGNLVIKDSVWQHNAAGIVPNSLDSQANPPQRGTTIVDNVISNNGNPNVPGSGTAGAVIGHGVAIAGGHDNVIEGNVIEGNTKYGVVLFPMPETGGPGPYLATNNAVRNNNARFNGEADLALAVPAGEGNCFAGNTFDTSAPAMIEDAFPCDGPGLNAVPGVGDPLVSGILVKDYLEYGIIQNKPRPSYADMPAPPPQPTMPNPDPEAA